MTQERLHIYVSLCSSWDKIQSLENIINYFKYLGIPFPEFQDPIGAVVLMTARSEGIGSLSDLFKIYEYGHLVILLILTTIGAQLLSLDHLIKNSLK